MKKMKFGMVAIWSLVVAALIVVAVYFFYINKPQPNYDKLSPDFSLSAAQLYTEFTTDKTAATAKYNGKMVAITGIPKAIEKTDSTRVVVFSFQEGMFGDEGVRCDLLKKYFEAVDQLKPGDSVKVKGFCAGYNETDVILEHGSLQTK